MNIEPNDVIVAIRAAALEKGRVVTRDGRRELRKELSKELTKIANSTNRADLETYAARSERLKEVARALIAYAEDNGEFQVKTKVGFAVVRSTIQSLRQMHEKTGVCKVWPFC